MGKVIPPFLFGILILACIWGSKVFLQTSYVDFRVYYEASQNTRHLGNPYIASDPNMSYLYPPITILFFLPLTFFSVTIAEKIWIIISLLLFSVAMVYLFRLLKISWKSPEGLLFLILSVLSFPYKFTLGMGQINMLILLFLVLFLYYYERRKTLSGFFLSLATLIKLSPILIVGYLLYKKQWEIFFAVLITILGIGVFSLILFPKPTETYVLAILPRLSQAWPLGYYNQSITGFLGRLPFPVISLIILRWLCTLGIVAATAATIKTRFGEREERVAISSIFPVLLLLSSFSWQHHFVLLIPSFVILTHVILTTNENVREKWILLFSVLISYLLISYNIKHPEMVPILFQSHVFYGTVLLWLLHLYVLRKTS